MTKIATQLQEFKFKELFNELGWDILNLSIEKEVNGQVYTLIPIAHKRGIQILQCLPNIDGKIPSYEIRQKIERKVTEDAREHLIIYTDENNTQQIWQWVSRVKGQTTQYREVRWQVGQPSELLEQKLKSIAFDIDEEESLTVFGVAERLRGGFDRDTVTKKFYKVFSEQRNAFQKFIDGIPQNSEDQKWYTAVIIDRLMFLWFLQEKFFLDNNKRYLRDRLESHLAAGKSISFYKAFLTPLFFRGFAEERSSENQADIQRQFGNVPYLNGGLFAEHDLERQYGEAIDIPDNAFITLFGFFDEWDWHLDERPLKNGREINPDVLGYIFEKFVNQKQMGAYYTKEDITDYISKNTIIPCLFEKVRAEYPVEFDAHAWKILKEDPRRYLYPAMLHGVDEQYPDVIAEGIDVSKPNLLDRRKHWNKTAEDIHALPTEIWRETIARHTRTREILTKLKNGEINSVADLVSYNLNIRQFAQDVIERCTDPFLIKSFWTALAGQMPTATNAQLKHGISILDPTCGSGAFLFAALQILKPLYQACLTAMDGILVDEAISGRTINKEFLEIEAIVKRFNANQTDRARDYAIIKHIIVHNLYGVDIETQATEIAKLRLFLKLVALLEPGDNIEPLPDIDFNIRAGNTIVGYATADETEQAVSGMVNGKIVAQGQLLNDAWDEIKQRLDTTAVAYNNFQIQQLQRGGHINPADKTLLKDHLYELDETLNRQLCRAYGKDSNKGKEYQAWKDSHKPFHWYVNFYPIMASGGFDVIIGNPPYVEIASKKVNYQINQVALVECGNLYAPITARSMKLLSDKGAFSFIVPGASVNTPRMNLLLDTLQANFRYLQVTQYDERPSKLFDGVDQQLCIQIGLKTGEPQLVVSPMRHWYTPNGMAEQRGNYLFGTSECIKIITDYRVASVIPKISTSIELELLKKILNFEPVTFISDMNASFTTLYYRNAGGRYWRLIKSFPSYFSSDTADSSSTEHEIQVITKYSSIVVALFSSSLFYWFWRVSSNCRHLTKREITSFISSKLIFEGHFSDDLGKLSKAYELSLLNNAVRKTKINKKTGKIEQDEYRVAESKEIIDQIDTVLARALGLSESQLDFIINYDIKYRMGQGASDDD